MGTPHDFNGYEFTEQKMDGLWTNTTFSYLSGADAPSLSSSSFETRNLATYTPFINGQVTGPNFSFGTSWYLNYGNMAATSFYGVYYRNPGGTPGTTYGIGVRIKSDGSIFLVVDNTEYDTAQVADNLTWQRFYINVDNGIANGSTVRLYWNQVGGSPIYTYVMDATDASNIGGMPDSWRHYVGNNSSRADDEWVLDESGAGSVTREQMAVSSASRALATAEGTYQDQASGAYTDINDLPSNTDAVILTTAGDKYSVVIPDPTSDNCYGITVSARIQSDGLAGSQVDIGLTDGTNEVFQTFNAPVNGYIRAYFDQAPSGGGPVAMTAALANNCQPFIRAVA